MAGVLKRLIPAALLATTVPGIAADAPAAYRYVLGTDLSYVYTDGYASWAEGAAGKLRFDDDSDGLRVSRAFADYKLRVADTLHARVVAEGANDRAGSGVDFTMAYLEWQPLTLSRNRYRFKLGAFYPHMSLENPGPAWTSPYTISSSAINTWLGEEVRVVGAEIEVSRRPQFLGGNHTFALHAALFRNNDPAGGLLAWKGWSLHDRQTRFGDEPPLPPLPQIQPGGAFERQDPYMAPFMEIDGTAGYYVTGEWQLGSRMALRVSRYDNRADPERFEDGQYAWYTEFSHIGAQAVLPWDIGFIAQWLVGETVMGPEVDGAHAVDVEFDSHFLLLTRAFDQHRVSLRYDHFGVSESDQVPLDDNSESGRAWTVAYRYNLTDSVAVAAEWLQVETERPAWAYFGLDTANDERQFILSLKLRFGNEPLPR